MKISYDESRDVLRILLAETPIETVNRNSADLTLDYDQDGILVGLEMHNTTRYMKRPALGDVDLIAPTLSEAPMSIDSRLDSV